MIMKEDSPISCKTAALQYAEKFGFSIIPVNRKTKTPFIPWKEFQDRKATEKEIREWWEKWPSANVGIVTGKISRVVVIDIDEPQGFDAIQEYIPDTLIIPTCKTPRGGQHLYFRAPEEVLGNKSRLIQGCDFRGDGGYIIAPPSTNSKGKSYAWLDGLSIEKADPPAMPSKLFTILRTYSYREKLDNFLDKNENPLKFQQGTRDEDLFHVANCLVKGQGSLGMSSQVLRILAANCNPPFDPKEADIKVKSALERAQRRERNISGEIREYILSSSGLIMSRDVQVCLGLSSREGQKLVWYVLNEMVKEGLVERITEKHGCYRTVDKECGEMDFINTPVHTVEIAFPFEIEKKVELMPGNIVVVAGEANAGKTAFLLNVVKENMNHFDIHYFNSEMGSSELRKRLSKFDMPLRDWRFKAKERNDNFEDVIVGGEGRINIVDFLEMYENFYLVGSHINEIYKKLNGAIAIIALQKNPQTDAGRGGQFGLEKPRLYLSMSKGN